MTCAPLAEVAYRFGQIEADPRMGRQRRLEAIASAFANALGLEACGVTVREDPRGHGRTWAAIHEPWSESEQRLFEEQADWPPEHRVLNSRLKSMPLGRMRPRRELVDDATFSRTRLYNELQRPMGIGDQISGLFRREDGAEMLLSVAAKDDQSPLPRRVIERAQALAIYAYRCWSSSWRAEPVWAERLSPQCRRVLEHVGAGYDDHQIAQRMGVTYHTVRAHLKRIFRQAGVGSRLHLIQQYRGIDAMDGEPTSDGEPTTDGEPTPTALIAPGV